MKVYQSCGPTIPVMNGTPGFNMLAARFLNTEAVADLLTYLQSLVSTNKD